MRYRLNQLEQRFMEANAVQIHYVWSKLVIDLKEFIQSAREIEADLLVSCFPHDDTGFPLMFLRAPRTPQIGPGPRTISDSACKPLIRSIMPHA